MKGAQGQLFHFAATGSLSSLKTLVAEGVDPKKEVNYDSRTALHLAAAEGHLDVVKYLLEEVKVPVNPLDRWQNTPLTDAVRSRHEAVANVLYDAGGHMNLSKGEAGRDLCRAAADGGLVMVEFLLKIGTPVTSSDADGRTPLHFAAAAGHRVICERLMAANADVNAMDRFGATPIADALQFKHFELAQLLRSASAKVADLEAYKKSEQILSAIHQTLIMLCSRDGWCYGAAWISEKSDVANVAEAWYANTKDVLKVAEWRQISESTALKLDKTSLVGRAFVSGNAEWVDDCSATSAVDMSPATCAKVGFSTSVAIPITVNGVNLCTVELRSFTARPKDEALVSTTLATATRMIAGNLFQSEGGKGMTIRGYQADVLHEVFRTVLASGVFTESIVRKEVDWYFTGLGMHEFYWKQFTPAQISQHVMAFIAAKLQGQTTNTSGAIRYKSEEESSALYIYPVEEAADVERRIDSRWLGEGYQGTKALSLKSNESVSIKSFLTAGTASADSTQKLIIYSVSINEYVVDPAVTPVDQENSAWKVATGAFLCEKSFQARSRYESVLAKAIKASGPTIDLDRPTQRPSTGQDSIVITVCYKRGSTHSFFSQLSQLLTRSGHPAIRKYVENFANGYVAFSFHASQMTSDEIHMLKRFIGLTWLLPRTTLSPLVDQGVLNLPASQWAYCGWKFVYHFLAGANDDWNNVWELAKGNVNARAQLLKLKKRLQNEAATETRIAETIAEYADIVTEMYTDFRSCFDPTFETRKTPSFNEALWSKIQKNVPSPVDQEILRTLLIFNRHILKTNFYKSEKIAIAFRLDPAFLKECDYTILPYGLFLVIGSEFRGFHVRFDDVARGGIRMIRSRNKQLWQRNAEGLFDENYNLAYTQTLKNKDIPESGSKGTVFLNVDHQDKDESAFRKYVDAILDCILPCTEVVDHHGKPEILFFGPDEGTAHFMDWAALHAKSRGYKFWSALTTGKSTALGGIPHDTYGMTTRGVHQYVLGVIRKLGLDETQLTKLQTGGPDGDLGSNEIKISKDQTIAIVDGSGVLCDPEGINRTELLRLATARKMVIHFDRSLLSPRGFLVLIDDFDVTLPDGRVVDNGMNFRNNFHLDPLASADLFVPCGGRPAAVNLSNVDKMFIGPDRKPMFKYIVEGANLFFTQEARLKLEEAGVVLFRDASTNKGGVTSSSSEVLASLCMNDEEYGRLMCVKDGVIPEFYNRYVVDTQNRISTNADNEFECIWAESMRDPTVPRCLITDHLSQRINELNYQIRDSGLWDDAALVRTVLAQVIPPSLQAELGLDRIMERLPKSYVDATLSSYLAAKYVYSHGLKANEFAFYQFMAQFRKQ